MNECAPTVRGEIRKARASNYDLCSALNEFIDNSLDAGATTILIDVRERIEDGGRWIHKILVSDNAPSGIEKDTLKDIFSWTYERQREGGEIGEFGTGFKSASVNIGNKLTILTVAQQEYLQAVADWHEMADENIWTPRIMVIDEVNLRCYHPFATGTTLMIENIRHEFVQQQKGNDRLLHRILADISLSYKYLLQKKPGSAFILRGYFTSMTEKEISYGQRNENMCYYFDHTPMVLLTEVIVLKDPSGYHIYLQREDKPYWESIELVEKKKTSNVFKSSHVHPFSDKMIVDRMIFRSCTTFRSNEDESTPHSYGTVDIVRNHRVLATNITYRPPRADPHCAYLKHELLYENKMLNSILGIQFNKSNDGQIPEGDMRFTLEFVQKLHERELIRLEKQKMGRVVTRDKEEEFLSLDKYQFTATTITTTTIGDDLPSPLPIPEATIPPLAVLASQVIDLAPSIPIPKKILPPPAASLPMIPSKIPPPPPPPPERRKNFTMETKLEVIKKQECRDVDFDFRLQDDILPIDFDHKNGQSSNNSQDNCQALSVISHALKTRRPDVLEQHRKHPIRYITNLLNCITSSKVFIEAYNKKEIIVRPSSELNCRDGLFLC